MADVAPLSKLFLERSKFIVIGLTGRTGSGCTTAASIMESSEPDIPAMDDLRYKCNAFYDGLDSRRYEVLSCYAKNNWKRFFAIKISDLISAYLLAMDIGDLASFVAACDPTGISDAAQIEGVLSSVAYGNKINVGRSKRVIQMVLDHESDFDPRYVAKRSILRSLVSYRKFTNEFKAELDAMSPGLYVETYQAAGNSIRKLGRVSVGYKSAKFDPGQIFHLPETINRIIKILRKSFDSAFVVIDAIRNPYEARFFRERYSAFYLVSINAPDEDRSAYLRNVRKFDEASIKKIDEAESGSSAILDGDFVAQNVKRCIEMSDIHLFNPRNELDNSNILKSQIVWYVSLMIHPGLVPPTAMERVMQIAFTAKTNSGCISRQVGAVITDTDNSIKAVGWNDVPSGQIPCSLRSLDRLLHSFDPLVYSDYERNDKEFRSRAAEHRAALTSSKELLSGRNLSYCFKDLKNSLDSKGNQVHTRSLHAEENAFLQLSKYGGKGILGGKLYTTASPCELCAKKAYQLGVKEIVYIDPYPGISRQHVISIGSKIPELVQFRGAVGKGYHQLYEQTLPYKDELEYFDDGSLKRREKRKKVLDSIKVLSVCGLITQDEMNGLVSKVDDLEKEE
ncbi:anti-phage dCTP deaminase [Ectothiorhodospira lacustris]|uniref:anti-phage dCTP deaminase n=1 Tax=Ectothiorhodospira lacustris TaxID=2899127 RepID=UPI001EE8455C|nr:anti-phage dCTP deaminase [Ectothiorhodospira lacustris]MCG5509137.1 hypothetical protein [Ectothiorhodospira lacustris]MCG5520928.1 hypothetical protein [Ectothiorhodospira lacustris]